MSRIFANGEVLNILRRVFICKASFVFFTIVAPTFVTGITANAESDFSIGSSFRSYPLSGVLEVQAGYGIVAWGDSTSGSPWYGYVRPYVEAASAVTYNSLAGAVEVFPLSFLGARAGGEAVQNDNDYSSYDCVAYSCLGRYYRTFVEAELDLGAAGFFLQGKWRRERWTQKDPDIGDFIEPTSGLALVGAGDSETVYNGIIGYNVDEEWAVMGFVRYAENSNSDGLSRFPGLLVRYRVDGISIGIGGGAFESTLKKQSAAALAYLRWEISPSVALR